MTDASLRLDRYRVLSVLYDGEFTQVFGALHQVLGSKHALKVVQPDADPDIADALLREGRIQAVVRHPNVLTVGDAFEMEDGRVALVMDWVRGRTLADMLDLGDLPQHLVMPVVRSLARGLRAVHKRQIVHRDLKPENVLLLPTVTSFRPLLADFGLAKLLDKSGAGRFDGISGSFGFLGTPEYMAPEQARDPKQVDTRADLFSLGAILYELLTGNVCFDEEDPVDAIRRAASGDFRPLRECRADLDPKLDAIVASLLDPDPNRRPASVGRLLRQLDLIRKPS